jgi:hypothetical protein
MTLPGTRVAVPVQTPAEKAEERRKRDLARRMELLVAKMNRDAAYDAGSGPTRAPLRARPPAH